MTKMIREIFSLDVLRNSKILSISPERYALSLTFGFYIGLFPMIGVTTVLCLIATLMFRLNTWLVQGMNVLMAPLHYLMIYPFLKLGRILFFNDSPIVPHISLRQFLSADKWDTVFYLLESMVGGIVVWGIISSLTGFFVYRAFLKYRLQVVKS
jgi:uncharacterized protein (DUF2062 family)